VEHIKLEILRSCKLFDELGDASLDPIARTSQFQNYPKRSSIFSADDEADGLRIILDGDARVFLTDPDGRELTLAIMSEGESFGEIALLDGMARSANVAAMDNVQCLFLPNHAMQQAMATDLVLMQCLVRSLCKLMRSNMDAISSFAFNGLAARLAELILELSHKYAEVNDGRAIFTRRFSQTDLGALLGVSREAINKRFKALQYDGLVEMDNNRIIIRDIERLKQRFSSEGRIREEIF